MGHLRLPTDLEMKIDKGTRDMRRPKSLQHAQKLPKKQKLQSNLLAASTTAFAPATNAKSENLDESRRSQKTERFTDDSKWVAPLHVAVRYRTSDKKMLPSQISAPP